MQRTIFEEEHEMFRDSVRKFCEREIAPFHEDWEKVGNVPKELWLKAGENGFLCMDVPEEYGGLGLKDFRYNTVLNEELTRVGASGVGFGLQNDVCVPYVITFGTEEQKKRWLPKMVSGELIMAIAMTEPNTGSDLAGVRTTAIKNGSGYIVNGQKTFITNGLLNDAVIVVAKTDPKSDNAHQGFSLIVVERSMEGYMPPRKLDKMGLHAQDTAELFFNEVNVPETNLLGTEGSGFYHLMQMLPQERLSISVGAVAGAEKALEMTIQYCKDRKAFGRPIGKFQNSRFKLAEMKTEIELGRVFVDRSITLLNEGKLTIEEAAMGKWWTTEMMKRTIDTCVQLHGGYGYMMEYPICKAYLDCRVMTIFGGTTEIMKEIIGRSMGF